MVSWLQGVPTQVEGRYPHRVEIEAVARPHFERGPLSPRIRLVPATKGEVELSPKLEVNPVLSLGSEPTVEPGPKPEVEATLGAEPVLTLEVEPAGLLPEPSTSQATRLPSFPSGTIRTGSALVVKVVSWTFGCVRGTC